MIKPIREAIRNIERGCSVEIGAWDGVRFSNTRALLEPGWFGGYIEADRGKFAELKRNIEGYRASCANAMVSLESGSTLDDVIDELALPEPLTLLNIDVDGNDHWMWRSVERHIQWSCVSSTTRTLTRP